VLTTRYNLADVAPERFPPLTEAIPKYVPEAAPAAAPAEQAPAPAAAEAELGADLDIDLPAEVKAVIANKIQVEIRKVETQMEAAYQERESRLLEKLAALESMPTKAGKGK